MLKAFSPSGAATVTIAATTTSASATLDANSSQVRVVNAAGGSMAFIRFSTGASTAVATDMPIAPGTDAVFTKGTATHVAAICATGTATLYFTNGEGM